MNEDQIFHLLDTEWHFFRLADVNGDPHLFYRCPACGCVLDWRDQDKHLTFHGFMNTMLRAEIIKRQEAFADVRGRRS